MVAALTGPLWTGGRPPAPGSAPLTEDLDCDVAIVGGGYTGLWTALALSERRPSWRIVVLEAETLGFGASSRNGGWCSDLFPVSGPAAAPMRAAARSSIAAIGERAADWGVPFTRGGSLIFARTPAQVARAKAAVDASLSDDSLRYLTSADVAESCGAAGVLGATFTPHCAALDPAALLRGLAAAAVSARVEVYERSPVTSIDPGIVRTGAATVRAPVVLLATEAFTHRLRPRALAPVYSLVTTTAPLDDARINLVGLTDRPTFSDYGHVVIYGQRTSDNRIVFGGRGAPYHFGSRITPAFDSEPAVFADLERTLISLFPALEGIDFTHRWGGPIGIPRDWHPSVRFDPATGLGGAGGYVGDGVALSHLAGTTLADLVTGTHSVETMLPWVGHRSRRWEPEPLRWAGINAGIQIARFADTREAATGRPSRLGAVLDRFTGG